MITLGDLAQALRAHPPLTSSDPSGTPDRDLAPFIAALETRPDVALPLLTAQISRLPAPKTKRPAKGSPAVIGEKTKEAITNLHRLSEEAKAWPSPDGDRARSRVRQICQGLTKLELTTVSKAFLSKANSGVTKEQLLDLLAQPVVWQLSHRFTNKGS
ncbi:MAG: hypothetical protein KGS60_10630 [Verrucomicrobia bacterium]|nr:hypothetical protein [Verrucomicrobiota bacterium]